MIRKNSKMYVPMIGPACMKIEFRLIFHNINETFDFKMFPSNNSCDSLGFCATSYTENSEGNICYIDELRDKLNSFIENQIKSCTYWLANIEQTIYKEAYYEMKLKILNLLKTIKLVFPKKFKELNYDKSSI